jgi:hypothetical protein
MHEPAHMILVVANTESSLDGHSQSSGCPAISGESVRHRTFGVHGPDGVDLIGSKPARPSGSFPLAQTVYASMNNGTVPAGSGCAANAIMAGHL